VPEETKVRKDADHLTPQFLIVIQKYDIDSILRMDGAMIARNERAVENNEITQK
jgi:hypothetical protein